MILNRPAARPTWHRVLLGGSIAIILLLPSSLPAFFIIWAHPVHQDITLQGLNPLGPVPVLQIFSPKFELTLDTGNKVTFSNGSIVEITEHNVATDELQGPLVTRLHFDSEDLKGGSDRLIRLRQQIIYNLAHTAFFDFTNPQAVTERAVRVSNSRALLGRALHTLQDFYAHTNWVERHPVMPEIDSRLGNDIVRSPPPNTECDSSDPGQAQLTSGWFLNDLGDGYCGAPENKCAHGGLNCGIHKDFGDRNGFASAMELAIKATNVYTKETLQAVLASYSQLVPALGEAGAKQAVNLAVCEFMDVPDAFSTCLTSHTLSVQKINQVGGGVTSEGLVQSAGGNITPAIDCGLLCEGVALAGTEVTLIASDTGNWKFVRWAPGGACSSSTNPACTVSMSSNITAIAEFSDTSPPNLFAGFTWDCGVSAGQSIGTCIETTPPESLTKTYEGSVSATNNGEFIASASVEGSIARLIGAGLEITAHIETTALGQWAAGAHFHATVDYEDSIQVTSPTVPNGTPVTVRITLPVQLAWNSSGSLTEPEVDSDYDIQWPGAYALLRSGSETVTVTMDQPSGYSGSPTGAAKNTNLELVVSSAVGNAISYRVILEAQLSSGTTRAAVELDITGATSGPYFQELSGKNVRFER
jgi:hypothetical protein